MCERMTEEYEVARPELAVRALTRRFAAGGGIDDVSLTVSIGEFFVLLGPSGCGKSTLLRLIAGLESPDRGEIMFGDESQPSAFGAQAPVAMVFQNYALYPHMTAFENIAFPLRMMRLERTEIDRRVRATARLAGLAIDLARRPAELSGGERQRVALARALVREPRIILMDEPLSNLDAQLRASLRSELKDFQRRTGRTFVYVTHDQLEAMTLADRLALMRSGRIEQVGPPMELYDRPANEFVASFLGQPPMNLIRVRAAEGGLIAANMNLRLVLKPDPPEELTLGFRPEAVSLYPVANEVAIETIIERAEFAGGRFIGQARVGGSRVLVELPRRVAAGSAVTLYVAHQHLHFFDSGSGRRLEFSLS